MGRINLQNDELTFKIAKKDELWFHKDIPAATSSLQEIPTIDEVKTDAAELAAYYSGPFLNLVRGYDRSQEPNKPTGGNQALSPIPARRLRGSNSQKKKNQSYETKDWLGQRLSIAQPLRCRQIRSKYAWKWGILRLIQHILKLSVRSSC